ncbi:MAG: radical SAM protein [Leptospiraceae bacterium]|nr:radical SAM protein [Leptospiraceae bacterium]
MENKSVLNFTTSVCDTCKQPVSAKVITDGRDVFLRKFCTTHGEQEHFIRSDVTDYLYTQRFVKPASMPMSFNGNEKANCLEGCGFCSNHEQHLCMPIVEITEKCNLNCPVCINSSGESGRHITPDEFKKILDSILSAEPQIDVLNISGGEPLLHPQLFTLLDEALSRKEIIRVSISTNGLLLKNLQIVEELKKRDIVVSLQFDGFDDSIYEELRSIPMLEQKMEILRILQRYDVTTSLTMTVARGLNDFELPKVANLVFQTPNIISLMLQPIAFAGRGKDMEKSRRITIPDIIEILDKDLDTSVKKADFVPLPCSSPLCFSLSFYLMPKESGNPIPINQLVNAEKMMDSLSNRVFFGLDADEYQEMNKMVYDLWSGPMGSVPEGEQALKTIKGLLKEINCLMSNNCFDPKKFFTTTERKVKSIFIHAFMDSENFDLARVRRCCQAYPQTDGKLIPACVFNVKERHLLNVSFG